MKTSFFLFCFSPPLLLLHHHSFDKRLAKDVEKTYLRGIILPSNKVGRSPE